MDKEIKIAGKKIFYRIYGNGKPVMLVHGFGETGDVWTNQNDSLQEQFMLIVPDLPGSGQSDMIDDMSMEGMAEAMKDILDHESISTCMTIGHSMGGYITLAFAEKYPNYLSAFGLFHSTAFPDTEEKKATRRKGIEFIKEHGAFEFLKTSTPNLFSPTTKDQSPQLVDEFVQSLDNFKAGSLVSCYEAMINRPDRVHVLKETSLPVLFVAGEYDNAIPLQDILKQCHLPGKSYFYVLHQSGHMGMLEETGKSNRLLVEFLNQL